MIIFHQIIFYILWVMIGAYDVYADVVLWRKIKNGTFYELVQESSEELDEFRKLVGDKAFARVMTGMYSLITCGVLLVTYALYRQVRFFQIPLANRAGLALLMISIVSGIFEFSRFPLPMRPNRQITRVDKVFMILFSASCYSLLVTMLIVVV